MGKLKQFVSTSSLIAVLGGIAFVASATAPGGNAFVAFKHIDQAGNRDHRYLVKWDLGNKSNGWYNSVDHVKTVYDLDGGSGSTIKLIVLDDDPLTGLYKIGSSCTGLQESNQKIDGVCTLNGESPKTAPNQAESAQDSVILEVNLIDEDLDPDEFYNALNGPPLLDVNKGSSNSLEVNSFHCRQGNSYPGTAFNLEGYFKSNATLNKDFGSIVMQYDFPADGEFINYGIEEQQTNNSTYAGTISGGNTIYCPNNFVGCTVPVRFAHKKPYHMGGDILRTTQTTNLQCKPQCSDGMDNDLDGNTDMADPNCAASGANWYDESKTSQCHDGVDNDDDGPIDGDDLSCQNSTYLENSPR